MEWQEALNRMYAEKYEATEALINIFWEKVEAGDEDVIKILRVASNLYHEEDEDNYADPLRTKPAGYQWDLIERASLMLKEHERVYRILNK